MRKNYIRKLGLSPSPGESLSCTYAVGKFYTFLSAKKENCRIKFSLYTMKRRKYNWVNLQKKD